MKLLVVLPLGVFSKHRKEKKERLLIKRGFLEKLNGWGPFWHKSQLFINAHTCAFRARFRSDLFHSCAKPLMHLYSYYYYSLLMIKKIKV